MRIAGNEEPFFYIVRPGDSLSAIARDVLGAVTRQQMADRVQDILAANPHIQNPNLIHPGQFLALVPAGGRALCRLNPHDLEGLEHAWKGLEPGEREVIQEGFDIVGHLTDASMAHGDAAFTEGRRYVQARRNALTPPSPQLRVIDQLVFERVHRVWLDVRAGTARIATSQGLRVRRNRLIRLVRDGAAWQTYTNRLREYGRTAKALATGHWVLRLADYGVSAKHVAEKWMTQQRYQTLGREVGAKLGGGLAGGGTAYLVCSSFLALPSGGSSLFWCGVLAGGVGGFGGGWGGGVLGEAAGSLGDKAAFGADKPLPLGELP